MDALTLRLARVAEAPVLDLIERHHALMRSASPEDSCHVMRPDALEKAGAVLVAAEAEGTVFGIGAYTDIGEGHAELKSMHTTQEARGRGVGQAVLTDLMDRARSAGFTRMSLETGSTPDFTAARRLYERNGFIYCPPFGSYVVDPFSVFMTLDLTA